MELRLTQLLVRVLKSLPQLYMYSIQDRLGYLNIESENR